jgi:hypothetical protein
LGRRRRTRCGCASCSTSTDGNARWYALAASNASRALANARDARGLFLRGRNGRPVAGGYLRMQAGTLSLFAWLATVPPPKR